MKHLVLSIFTLYVYMRRPSLSELFGLFVKSITTNLLQVWFNYVFLGY